MLASMRLRWRECLPFWSADDPGRGRCADLDCHRPHRHEERHEWPGVAGAGGRGEGSCFAKARVSDDQALIAHLKLQIEKLNRDRYGQRSERTARLLDQLELTLEELETAATEDELAAEMAAAKAATTKVASRSRASGRPANRSRSICPGNG